VGDHRDADSDFLEFELLLDDEDRSLLERVRCYLVDTVEPVINGYWTRAEFPHQLVPGLAELGIAGLQFDGPGCPGRSSLADGMVAMELARVDPSIQTFMGVHGGLAMGSVMLCGSPDQQERWLPGMARLDLIGAFGLTEPEEGSGIAGGLSTSARREGEEWVLDGEKKWIGNATFSDVAVIWARTDDGRILGFLVETDNPGFQAEVLPRKASQRAAWQTHITLRDCHVPGSARLPKAEGLGSTLSILTHSRYGVGWDGLGQASDCYETALAYAGERKQFGQPIASFQLVQQKLVEMVNEISLSQLLSIHVGRLKDAGELDPATVSMFKMNNVAKARRIAALARDVLGGNGILLDYRVMEHMADIEGVYTYEGTNDVNTLIVGQAITGHRAFSPSPPQRADENGE
jgi:glutaryl-CoA dehydrogenase